MTDRSIFLGNQAWNDAPHYQHSRVGYNYMMSNVLTGIGRGQKEIIEEGVKKGDIISSFTKKNWRSLKE